MKELTTELILASLKLEAMKIANNRDLERVRKRRLEIRKLINKYKIR